MKRRFSFNKLLCLCTVFILSASVLSAPILGGGASDPLITKSYLNATILPGMETALTGTISQGFSLTGNPILVSITKTYNDNLARLAPGELAKTLSVPAAARLRAITSTYHSSIATILTLSSGDRVSGAAGTQFILLSGSAKVGGPSGSVMLNITNGKTVAVGGALAANNSYLLSEKGDAYLVASSAAAVAVCGKYRVTPAFSYKQQNVDMAFALSQMNLLAGTGSGFKLDRKAMRSEGLVMMLNFMGLAKEASKATGSIPFTDVHEWMKPYVVYAYKNGLTAGTSSTKFSPDALMSANEYVTFLLRAIGYQDGGKDFTWDTAVTKAKNLGIYTAGEYTYLTASPFVRDKMVYASFYMLNAQTKSSGKLLDLLISQNVTTREQAEAAMSRISRTR